MQFLVVCSAFQISCLLYEEYVNFKTKLVANTNRRIISFDRHDDVHILLYPILFLLRLEYLCHRKPGLYFQYNPIIIYNTSKEVRNMKVIYYKYLKVRKKMVEFIRYINVLSSF